MSIKCSLYFEITPKKVKKEGFDVYFRITGVFIAWYFESEIRVELLLGVKRRARFRWLYVDSFFELGLFAQLLIK